MISTVIVRYIVNNPSNPTTSTTWYKALKKANEEAEGFIDRTELPPVEGEAFHSVVLRFKNPTDAQNWLDNDARKQILEQAGIDDISQIKSAVHQNSAFWFTPGKSPVKWKQVVLSLISVYPLTQIIPKLVNSVFTSINLESFFIEGIVISIFISVMMVYVMMPLVFKLFKRWI